MNNKGKAKQMKTIFIGRDCQSVSETEQGIQMIFAAGILEY